MLLKIIARMRFMILELNKKKFYLFIQLKFMMIYHEYSIFYFIINSSEYHSLIALFYASKEIDFQKFILRSYNSELYLKKILTNSLIIIKYFHNMITIIIDKLLKNNIFNN